MLERGRAQITRRDEGVKYIATYGGKHFHKLYAAFAFWEFNRLEGRNIEIIDWGCGQAIATCILIDYLIVNGFSPNITSITLIEPSLIALERGKELIHQIFQTDELEECKINFVNKSIDDVLTEDLESESNSIKIHLFSNIIDMPVFDLNNLHELIVNSFHEYNILVVTSPFQHSRIDRFRELFENSHEFIKAIDSIEPIIGEFYSIANSRYQQDNIPRYERQFAIYLP